MLRFEMTAHQGQALFTQMQHMSDINDLLKLKIGFFQPDRNPIHVAAASTDTGMAMNRSIFGKINEQNLQTVRIA